MSKPLVSDEEIERLWGEYGNFDKALIFTDALIALVRKRLAERLRELAPSMAGTIRLRDAARIVEGDNE